MTKKRLTKYIAGIMPEIKIILEGKYKAKTPQALYNDAVLYMLKARDSLRRSEYANLSSYMTSSKMFDDEWGFSYSAFIHGSYEHNIAHAFLSLVMCHYRLSPRDGKEITLEKKAMSSFLYSIDDCMNYIFPAGMSSQGYQISLSQLNHFCNDRNINLEYYTTMLIANILLFNMAGLEYNYDTKQKYAIKQEKPI